MGGRYTLWIVAAVVSSLVTFWLFGLKFIMLLMKGRGLREVYRVLKPGGIVSSTEEFLDPDYPRRKPTIYWAEEAGFVVDKRFGNWWNYTLNFRKPG